MKKSKQTGRFTGAVNACTKRVKDTFRLNPEQQKVFALTLATALIGGGGLGAVVDGMRTEATDTKFAHGEEAIVEIQDRLQTLEKEPGNLKQEFESLKGVIAGFQATWEKKKNHEHQYGDWENPVQIDGNFATPQFFQYRKCLICSQADARSTW